MKSFVLRVLSFGSAKVLTQGDIFGELVELDMTPWDPIG